MQVITKEQQSDMDTKRDRAEVKISEVTNGFTIKVFPNFYVYKTLEEVVDHVRNHFTK